MAFYKLLLGLSLLCFKRESTAQSFGIEQQDQMAQIEWTKEDFLDIKIEPTRFEVETDAEDKLACAATVVMAITAALIFASLLLVVGFLWYIRCQIKAFVNVENNILHQNRWREFTGSLNTFDYIQSSSARNPPEVETESTSLSMQSTSHQNIPHDCTYAEIDNCELDYRSPEIDSYYDEVQDPSLHLSALQTTIFVPSIVGDISNVVEMDARSEEISHLNNLEIV